MASRACHRAPRNGGLRSAYALVRGSTNCLQYQRALSVTPLTVMAGLRPGHPRLGGIEKARRGASALSPTRGFAGPSDERAMRHWVSGAVELHRLRQYDSPTDPM